MPLVNADVATSRVWPVLPKNVEPQDSGVWAELRAWGCKRFTQRAARFVSDSAGTQDVTPRGAPAGFSQETPPPGPADPAHTQAGAGRDGGSCRTALPSASMSSPCDLQEFILSRRCRGTRRRCASTADLVKLWLSVGCSGRMRQIRAHPDLAPDQRQVLTLVPAVPSMPVLAWGN